MRYSFEREFILSCLKGIHCARARDKCAEMISGVSNWEWILGTVTQAKIASVFFYELQSEGLIDTIPSEFRRRLKKHYYKTGYRNIRILEQAIRLMRVLAGEQVESILLKGGALQVEVLQNHALREMADIDLLVRLRDLGKAEQALLRNGYVPMEAWHPAEYYRRSHHHLAPYYNPKETDRIPFEIHHNIAQPKGTTRLDMDAFWETSRTVTYNDSTVAVLSPENLLMHLCMSLAVARVFIGQVRYLLDLSQIVKRFGATLDWDYIAATVHARGVANYIYYPLYFSKTLLDVPIPQKTLDRMHGQVTVKAISHRLLRFLVGRYILMPLPGQGRIPGYKLRSFCRDIIGDVGVAQKLRTLRREIHIPKKWKDRISGDVQSIASHH